MLSVCQATQHQMIGKVNDELEQMWNEAVMAEYKVPTQPSSTGANEEKNKKSQSEGTTQKEGMITAPNLFIRKDCYLILGKSGGGDL
jgi:hypothetical protein